MTVPRERDLASWRAAIEKELQSGEKVRWAGLPAPDVAIHGGWFLAAFRPDVHVDTALHTAGRAGVYGRGQE